MGSIPALSTLPDCAPLAWAEPNPSSSDTSEITDPEIKNLEYAYKIELANALEVGKDASFRLDYFVNKQGQVFDFNSFFDVRLNGLKKAFNSNKYFVEIPVKGNYTAIKNSNTSGDHASFYSFLNAVDQKVLTQPDVWGNTLLLRSKEISNSNSDYKDFLRQYYVSDDSNHTYRSVGLDTEQISTSSPVEWSLGDNYSYVSDAVEPLKTYYFSSPINADVKQESFQHMYISDGIVKASMNYKKYSLLSDESKRISKVGDIFLYRVQLNQCLGLSVVVQYYNSNIGYQGWYYDQWRSASQYHMYALGIDVPLHTLARLVKDVDVEKPQNKIALSSETTLTDDDKTAIKNAYKEQYVAAFSKTNDNYDAGELRKKVAGGEVYLVQSGNEYYVYIKVPGIKTQKVKMSDIYQSLDGARAAAKNAISKLQHLTSDQTQAAPGEVDSANSQVVIDTVVAKYTLQDKINEANELKKKDTYNKATDKTAFDKALKTAIEKSKDQNAKAEDLTQATTDLDTAIKALDGDLNAAKAALNSKINEANELKKKDTYNKATDKTAFDKALKTAIEKSKDQNAKAEDLTQATTDLDTAIKALDGDLNAAKAALNSKINEANELKKKDTYNKATDKTAFDKALKTAIEKSKDQNAKAEDLTQATTDLDTAIKALDGDLNAAKQEAKPKIAALNNLSDDEKKGYTDQIDNAKTKEEVYGIVTKATTANNQTLEDAKKAGKKEIDDLENLDNKTKDQFKNEIDKKTTKPDITKVVNEAKAKDLPLAKEKAKKAIDALPNLKDEEKKELKGQVQAADNSNKVADILSQAKKQNSDRDSHSNPFGYPLPEGYGTSSSSDAATKPEDTKKFATTPLYRLYNPWTGEHLFTTSAEEHEHLARVGWKDEGITGKVATKEGKPVHRLLNPTTGEHHYTTDPDELKACIAAGWKDEGVHFYSNGDKPVYSMYNPNEQSFYHHYTSNKEEIAKMVKDGWKNEGVKWYCAGDDE